MDDSKPPQDPKDPGTKAGRQAHVEKLMCTGTRNIVERLCISWNVDTKTITSLMRAVERDWQAADDSPKNAKRAKLRAVMWDFYNRALKERSFSAACNVLERIARLDGIYDPVDEEEKKTISLADQQPDVIRERIKTLMPLVNAKKPQAS